MADINIPDSSLVNWYIRLILYIEYVVKEHG